MLAGSGGDAEFEISERPRKHIEIVGQGGSQKGQLDHDAGAGEFIDRARGQDLYATLRQRLSAATFAAHELIGRAVDACQGGEAVRLARPMRGGSAVQMIGG